MTKPTDPHTDTLEQNLKIWSGTDEQIQTAIENGDITDTSISIATDVDYVQPNEIGNGVLTIQKNGTTIGTFSANSNQDTTVSFSVTDPVKSDWEQDNPDSLDYIKNKPTIAQITVKRFE